MPEVVDIAATIGAERTQDGKVHGGKRKITLPVSFDFKDLEAWAKAAAAETQKHGLKFSPVGIIQRGYTLLHQQDMGRLLADKHGKPDTKTKKVRDLSAMSEI